MKKGRFILAVMFLGCAVGIALAGVLTAGRSHCIVRTTGCGGWIVVDVKDWHAALVVLRVVPQYASEAAVVMERVRLGGLGGIGEGLHRRGGTSFEDWFDWSMGSLFVDVHSEAGRKVLVYSGVPLALPLAGCALVPAYCFVVWPLRRRRRMRKGLCCYCGYDLRGSSDTRCSECGRPSPMIEAPGTRGP